MKNTIVKIGLLALAVVIAIAMCSFTTENSSTKVSNAVLNDWEEWEKVNDFVNSTITVPVQKKDNHKPSKAAMFSRCPSGYEPNYSSDSVKVDRFVYGKLNNYVGCSPKYICHFKVNVNKKIALVRGKDETEYIAVKDWLEKKYGAKQVKG
jgi:hypothetical protein